MGCALGGGIFALGMSGLNWGEMFTVGSVRISPGSVAAGEDGAGSGSVGTSWCVGDRGGGSLTVVSVGTSVSMGLATPVMVGLGTGIEVGLRGSWGISVRTASGNGMAVSPPRSCNANCPLVMAKSALLTCCGLGWICWLCITLTTVCSIACPICMRRSTLSCCWPGGTPAAPAVPAFAPATPAARFVTTPATSYRVNITATCIALNCFV